MSGSNGDERKELVAAAIDAAYAEQGYVKSDGEKDDWKVAAVLLGPISKAVANSIGDRDKVHILRDRLVGIAFPNVPGRDDWHNQEDPDLAEEIWNGMERRTWGIVDQNPSGKVQQLLNGESGLVLVRREKSKAVAGNVYVTRDIKCLETDVITPKIVQAKKRAADTGTLTELLMDRVPEHAKKLHSQLGSGYDSVAKAAKAITSAKLAQIQASKDDDKNGDDDGDE